MRVTLDEAAGRLKSDVVAIPTETVYGLAASINSPEAIEKIFTLKNRPRQNPLIIHVDTPEAILSLITEKPPQFDLLSTHFWPGPLTLILPAAPHIPDIVRAGLPTAAFRVPEMKLTRDLLKMTGPLVVPSANLSGRPSSTRAEHVEEDFGKDFPVLDGGLSGKGLESTILSYKQGHWRILRMGSLPAEAFEPVLGYLPLFVKPTAQPECPGQLFRHYAPKARLVLDGPAEVTLGFNYKRYSGQVIWLGSTAEEVASHLYDALREVDEKGYETARIDLDFPDHGLWKTIRERLLKASAN